MDPSVFGGNLQLQQQAMLQQQWQWQQIMQQQMGMGMIPPDQVHLCLHVSLFLLLACLRMRLS